MFLKTLLPDTCDFHCFISAHDHIAYLYNNNYKTVLYITPRCFGKYKA